MEDMRSLAREIRKNILELSLTAKSAHVGSALSSVEILTSVFHRKYRGAGGGENPDRFIMSKGHAAMALYAAAAAFGQLEPIHLKNYFKDDSNLWGHPAKDGRFPFIEWSTGSLGHGLGATTGFAYSQEKLQGNFSRLNICLLSDGECNEGSVWEAALFAGHHRLRSLCAIIDYNKIQSFGRCCDILNLESLSDKWRAFGWRVVEVDGHDIAALTQALESQSGESHSQPLCLIAHTIKGKGVKEIEDTVESHYKPINQSQFDAFGAYEE